MDSSLSTGTRVGGRYELVAPVVDAGITEAWTARDPQGTELRVSVLGPATPAAQSLIAPTWERLQPLSNPGILAPRELSVSDGVCFTATEPFDGRALANWIEGHRQADTRPGFGVVQRLFDRLAAALLSAHAAGVVHGALSPRCVLLKRVGQGQHHLRVCDLALGPFTLQSGTTPSWFEYQAPEQRAPRAEDGAGVDVFAAAVILAEMLTLASGPKADARETWGQFVREAKPPAVVERLVALRREVPRPVWEVVASGLALNPRERGGLQKFQRSLRETWTAVGEWDRSAFAEPDPPAPDPSRVRSRSSMVSAQPKARGGAEVIEGWQRAERAATVLPAAQPTYSAPVAAPAVDAYPPRSRTALSGTPAVATAATPAVAAPPRAIEAPAFDAMEPSEATEAIDLAAAEHYLQSLHSASRPTPPAPAVHAPHEVYEAREHTQAIDAAAFFEGSLSHVDALDDARGTAVLSQEGGVAAAIAAVGAGPRDESTRMLDLPESGSAAGFAAWTSGPGTAPDPYGRAGAADFGAEDPFGGMSADGGRASIPSYPQSTQAWSGATPTPSPASSPFGATLKSVPRSSIPSALPSPPMPAPTPEKLWGAAPTPVQRPSVAPAEPRVPAWQWAVLFAAIVGVGAAMYLALTAR